MIGGAEAVIPAPAWSLLRDGRRLRGVNLVIDPRTMRYPNSHVAAASGGAVLPVATLNVDSTAGLPANGSVLVQVSNGTWQRVLYQGVTPTAYTGCSGGAGTLVTGNTAENDPYGTAPFGEAAYWSHLWGSAWNWAWLKAQIDWAKAAGFNCVRLIGGAFYVCCTPWPGEQLHRAAFLDHLTTLLDYCRAQSMYFMASGGQPQNGITFAGYSDAGFQAELVAMAQTLVGYADVVIGFDVASETFNYYDGNAAWPTNASRGPAWNAAIRGVRGWTIPLTYSGIATPFPGAGTEPASWRANAATAGAAVNPYVDFHDMHWYEPPLLASDLATYWWSNPTLGRTKLVVGEFGKDVQDAPRAPFYQSLQALMQAVGPNQERCAGAIAWAAAPQDLWAFNDFGLWDVAGAPRAEALTSMQQCAY